MKQALKVKFTDFYKGFIWNFHCLYRFLENHFEIEESDDPDILIYSCYGFEFLNYDCPKIFFTAENIRPDFRFCDFAFSFDHLDRLDHYRLPLYAVYFYNEELTIEKNAKRILADKAGFCSFLVSNTKGCPERLDFFHQLHAKKKVASGGRYANNVGGPVQEKRAFIKDYVFNIAFENSSYPGYATEKIAEAWIMGAIPIYWGDPRISEDINPDCFINVSNFESFEDAIAFILQVDQSEELKLKYLSAPFYRNNQVPEHLQDQVIARKLKEVIQELQIKPKNNYRSMRDRIYYQLMKLRGGNRLLKIPIR